MSEERRSWCCWRNAGTHKRYSCGSQQLNSFLPRFAPGIHSIRPNGKSERQAAASASYEEDAVRAGEQTRSKFPRDMIEAAVTAAGLGAGPMLIAGRGWSGACMSDYVRAAA